MRRTHLLALVVVSVVSGCTPERPASRSSVVIAVGEQSQVPVPVLKAARNRVADNEVADLLFLRLANLKPGGATSGEGGFEPSLATGWTRRDSVTLAFDLDRRARWHDGQPVTARDVVFTFGLARDSAVSPTLAGLLSRIDSVYAEGDSRVVVHYRQPYAEQLYDAAFQVQPLPSHLLAGVGRDSLARDAFVQHPVGDGPYRWVRSDGTSLIELTANDDFFLGRPGIGRVIFRTAGDADARLNLLLSGEADVLAAVVPPLANGDRVTATGRLRLVGVPSTSIGYLLFNTRDPADTARPHPILSDVRVRRAIALALDRPAIVRAVLGPYGVVPYGPVSSLLWVSHLTPGPAPRDLDEARRLLAAAGWRDANGDGILDRRGRPLRLSINVPAPSAARKAMAALVQEQLRQAGIQADLLLLEGPVHGERRNAGRFDIDFSGASQDPTPAGLTQSWSCRGGSNVARYCDPAVDSMLARAIVSVTPADSLWRAGIERIEADQPAVFMYSPVLVYGVSTRLGNVDIRPDAPWSRVWRWSATGAPAAAARSDSAGR
jgi:peptide/nickel transport system substrate-binding protein